MWVSERGTKEKDKGYLKGTGMGTMVDLREITSRDPEPKRTKLTFILVLRFRIPQLKFYKTLSHIRYCFKNDENPISKISSSIKI